MKFSKIAENLGEILTFQMEILENSLEIFILEISKSSQFYLKNFSCEILAQNINISKRC